MKRLFLSVFLISTGVFATSGPVLAAAPQCAGLAATHIGTGGNDVIVGTAAADVIVAFGGNDTIEAGGGDDVICAGNGSDVVDAGSGDDTVYGGRGPDKIEGNRGNDTIRGGSGGDRIAGDAFGDNIGAYDDVIFGGTGPDKIWGGAGNDTIRGGVGEDMIFGGRDDDKMYGGSRDDLLVGEHGNDLARGGNGTDQCEAEDADCESIIPMVGPITIERGPLQVWLDGSVSHVEPVAAVDFAVKANASGMWVQANGALGNKRVWHSAGLATPGAPTTTWEAALELPARGWYSVSVRAVDDDGDVGHLRPRRLFRVFDPFLEVGLPLASGLYNYEGFIPLPEGTVLGRSPRDGRGTPIPDDGTGETVRLSGALRDSFGTVGTAIQDTATGLWLQSDGGFDTTMEMFRAHCFNCNDTNNAYWFSDAELPDGDYELSAFALEDVPLWSGGPEVRVAEVQWEFSVDGAVESAPQVAVDQSSGVVFGGTPVVFTGSATDDIGVYDVRVAVRDRATGLWLTSLVGAPVWIDQKRNLAVQLSDPDEPTTEWKVELDLPAGSYDLSVGVRDHVRRRTSIRPWLEFTVS